MKSPLTIITALVVATQFTGCGIMPPSQSMEPNSSQTADLNTNNEGAVVRKKPTTSFVVNDSQDVLNIRMNMDKFKGQLVKINCGLVGFNETPTFSAYSGYFSSIFLQGETGAQAYLVYNKNDLEKIKPFLSAHWRSIKGVHIICKVTGGNLYPNVSLPAFEFVDVEN